MQATLDASSLKPFTKALTCLSKFSEDLILIATHECLSLSATNSSDSAYCRFKYIRRFFTRYSVGKKSGLLADNIEEVPKVTGQLLTKSLLTILKHRAVEKTVDRCELSIVEAIPDSEQDRDQEIDSLESRLIVRLHCKHGIIKTHRLPLHNVTSTQFFDPPSGPPESRLSIGPKALKEMMEHFPSVKGNKGDPQLIWNFGDSEVQIKSLETSIDTRGKMQLTTELMISAAEFENYEIYESPTALGFQLREFNAMVSFADSIVATLDLRFTEPAQPLVIELDSDDTECLFAMSTNHVQPVTASQQVRHVSVSASKKRQRDEEDATPTRLGTSTPPPGRRKPIKVVQRQDVQPAVKSTTEDSRVMPPPSLAPQSQENLEYTQGFRPPSQTHEQPLFLQSSQVSAADEELIRSSGLGIEKMSVEEVAEMMDYDGEDFEMLPTQRKKLSGFEELFDDGEIVPTQGGLGDSSLKGFEPLFED